MKPGPIEYLHGVILRTPVTPAPEPQPAPAPPRETPWTNPVRTVGACPHDVIYSNCQCDSPKPTG